jgi:glutamate-1-semialdehyde 2,1-aminomutase
MEEQITKEEGLYTELHKKSYDMYLDAKQTIITGVASCYQNIKPYPIYFTDGSGCIITDVDDNEYVDLHCGFGVTIFGYKHPIITDALSSNVITPQIVGYPTPVIISASKKLEEIYKFPKWRFMNSGTEATLDAIRLARGYLNRKYIIKLEGGYHGHHDSVWVGITPNILEDRTEPLSTPYCSGIPEDFTKLTIIVESNNTTQLRSVINKYKDELAGIIIEPVMLNCGLIKLNDDFVNEISNARDQYDITIIYDLVKINSCSTTFEWGITPDIVTLGKSIAGGLPIGVIGMNNKYADVVSSGNVILAGTLNGNSHTINVLDKVINYLTPDIMEECAKKSRRIENEFNIILNKYNINGYAMSYGIKGSLFFSKNKIQCYADYYKYADKKLEYLWYLYANNRGFLIQIRDEWTVSLQTNDEHIERFIKLFDDFCVLVSQV